MMGLYVVLFTLSILASVATNFLLAYSERPCRFDLDGL